METSMNKTLKVAVVALSALFVPLIGMAQDTFEVSVGADVVSKYIWRGFDQGSGASIQPTLGMAYKGFSLTAWGSTSVTDLEPKEIDITLGYTIGGLSLNVTDYWWAGESQAYGNYKNSHYFEGAASYYFGEKLPLTLSVATMFAGGDRNEEGKQCYSTYFSAEYDIACPADITLTPSIGATTASYLHTGERVKGLTDLSLKASKELKITNSFSLPIFVQVTASPVNDKVYMVFGLTL